MAMTMSDLSSVQGQAEPAGMSLSCSSPSRNFVSTKAKWPQVSLDQVANRIDYKHKHTRAQLATVARPPEQLRDLLELLFFLSLARPGRSISSLIELHYRLPGFVWRLASVHHLCPSRLFVNWTKTTTTTITATSNTRGARGRRRRRRSQEVGSSTEGATDKR